MTVSLIELKKQIHERLSPIAVSEAQVQAEIAYILEYILHCASSDTVTDPSRMVGDDKVLEIEQLLEKRISGRIPIQYLVSKAYFYGLPFYVNDHVLIPRPETEHLVDHALSLTGKHGYRSFLDLGTGSGIIPLALNASLKKADAPDSWEIFATDLSEDALDVAKRNANALSLADRVTFLAGNLFEPVQGRTFDVILSNPPYVETDDAGELRTEVHDHEPHLALFAVDGEPSFYQRIAEESPAFLNPGGTVIVELGDKCVDHAKSAFSASGFSEVSVHKDYAGLDRVLIASGLNRN